MAVTQYIGARYVPVLADPLEWSSANAYEALTIVLYQGNSYTSRQAVPVGVAITNEDFWVCTGNYNAQVEAYRQEVLQFDSRITANADSNTAQDSQLAGTSNSGLKTLITNEETARSAADTAINEKIGAGFSSENSISGTIGAGFSSENSISAAISALNTAISTIAVSGNMFSGQKSIGFGDSNMRGTQAGAESIVYKKLCTMLGCTYDNRGVSGSAFDQNAEYSIISQVNAADYDADVRLVVLIGGINDWHYQTSLTNVGFAAAVEATIAAIWNKFPNAVLVSIFDQGQQWPSENMLTFPYELKRLTEQNARNALFVDSVDLIFEKSSMFYNQNHYSNEGTTLMAQRIYKRLIGRDYPLFSYNAYGTTVEGLANSKAMHSATFLRDTQSILNVYNFEIYQPTYTGEAITASTDIFDVLGGYTMPNHNNAFVYETPVPWKNPAAGSVLTDNVNTVMRFYMQNVGARNMQNCHMTMRNRGNLSLDTFGSYCMNFPLTGLQQPHWWTSS